MAKIIFKETVRADENTVNFRRNTCASCDYKKEEICTSCDCIIESKVQVLDSTCPEGKW